MTIRPKPMMKGFFICAGCAQPHPDFAVRVYAAPTTVLCDPCHAKLTESAAKPAPVGKTVGGQLRVDTGIAAMEAM